jgi:hypothetical protein
MPESSPVCVRACGVGRLEAPFSVRVLYGLLAGENLSPSPVSAPPTARTWRGPESFTCAQVPEGLESEQKQNPHQHAVSHRACDWGRPASFTSVGTQNLSSAFVSRRAPSRVRGSPHGLWLGKASVREGVWLGKTRIVHQHLRSL